MRTISDIEDKAEIQVIIKENSENKSGVLQPFSCLGGISRQERKIKSERITKNNTKCYNIERQ